MKSILTTIGVGRLLGVAMTIGIVVGAVIAVPLLASANEGDGESGNTRSVDVIEQFLGTSGTSSDLRVEQTFEDGDDSGPSLRFEMGGGPDGAVRHGANILETVAELTGTEEADVAAALEDGQTLVEYAAEHGVSEDALQEALLAGLDERLDEAVANGDMTQEEADQFRTEASEHVSELINGDMLFGRNEVHPFIGHSIGFGLHPVETAAELTGVEVQNVLEALQDGQTLAEFSEANGVTEDELVDAIITDAEERAAEAVADGDLTQEEADELLADLEEGARAMVNGEGPMFHHEEGSGPGGGVFGPFGGIFPPGACDDTNEGSPEDSESVSDQI